MQSFCLHFSTFHSESWFRSEMCKYVFFVEVRSWRVTRFKFVFQEEQYKGSLVLQRLPQLNRFKSWRWCFETNVRWQHKTSLNVSPLCNIWRQTTKHFKLQVSCSCTFDKHPALCYETMKDCTRLPTECYCDQSRSSRLCFNIARNSDTGPCGRGGHILWARLALSFWFTKRRSRRRAVCRRNIFLPSHLSWCASGIVLNQRQSVKV